MPIIKKNDISPERPVIVVLYGVPGSGKTSVATTAENTLVIDTDRGFDRAVQRVDTIIANKWQDVMAETEAIKGYKTIVIDTAKSLIDDYLATYVCELNYKLKTNGLKRFGEMANQFKEFINFLRSNGQDLVIVCHDKETAEGDIIKHSPDCTGQSKDLLIRIADQVGYVGFQNKQRVITFEPSDNFVGKNVAGFDTVSIPDATSKEFTDFMATLIKKIKQSIQSKSEAQRKAQEQLAALRDKLAECESEEDVDSLIKESADLPPVMKAPFFNEVKETLVPKGFSYDAKKKKFIKETSDETTDKGDSN